MLNTIYNNLFEQNVSFCCVCKCVCVFCCCCTTMVWFWKWCFWSKFQFAIILRFLSSTIVFLHFLLHHFHRASWTIRMLTSSAQINYFIPMLGQPSYHTGKWNVIHYLIYPLKLISLHLSFIWCCAWKLSS